ncbi:MAG: response regulator [Myxococcales bacterium]|nr:response regulator [Myxococcales bacterium]
MSDRPGKDDVRRALQQLRPGAGHAVLLVEPNPDLQSKLARLVTVHGHRVIGTSSLDGALALLEAFPVDLVLLAEEVCGHDPTSVVAELVSIRPHARIVIMTAPEPAESGVRPARFEALEYAPRPFDPEALDALIG